jgi:hypothetical protein
MEEALDVRLFEVFFVDWDGSRNGAEAFADAGGSAVH